MIFGTFATFSLSEYLQIQPELLFVGSGGRGLGETDPDNTYLIEKYSYISLPVLIKGVFSFINGDLFVLGGPAVQFPVGDRSEAGIEFSGGIEEPWSPYDPNLASCSHLDLLLPDAVRIQSQFDRTFTNVRRRRTHWQIPRHW